MLVAVDIKGSCMTSVSWSIKQTFCVHPQHNRIELIEVLERLSLHMQGGLKREEPLFDVEIRA